MPDPSPEELREAAQRAVDAQQAQPVPMRVDDVPESADAAAREVAQLDQQLMAFQNQAQMIAARKLFLQGWLQGAANRENRRAARSAKSPSKPVKKAAKRAVARKTP